MLSPCTAIPVGWFCPEYRVTTLSSPPYKGTEWIVPKPVSAQNRYSPSTTRRSACSGSDGSGRDENGRPLAGQCAFVDRPVADGEVNVGPSSEPPSSAAESEARGGGRLLPDRSQLAEIGPTARGANRTVTVHDLPGPRLVPVQVSAATLKAAEPATETVKTPEALPPLLASVNTRSGVSPRSTPDRTHTGTARTPAPPARPRRTPRLPAPPSPTTTRTNTAARR